MKAIRASFYAVAIGLFFFCLVMALLSAGTDDKLIVDAVPGYLFLALMAAGILGFVRIIEYLADKRP